MDTDLATRLDRSIGPAPDTGDPLAGLLAEGHRAVRRRRAGAIAACAAAVLVVAGGAALVTGGGADQGTPPAVTEPSRTADVDPAPGETAPPPEDLDTLTTPTLPAEFRDGELHVREGLEVLGELDNPWGVATPAHSAGLAVRYRGHTWWVAVYGASYGGGGARAVWAGDAEGLDFEGWVAAQQPQMVEAFEPGRLARYGHSGDLQLGPGMTVIDRIDNPFHVPAPAKSVALSLEDADGTTWWVALYWSGAQSSIASTPALEAPSSLETWVSQHADLVTTTEHEADGGSR